MWFEPIIHFVSFIRAFTLIFVSNGHNIAVAQVFDYVVDFFICTPFVHVKLQLSPLKKIVELAGRFVYGYITLKVV